jgi:hypothetical protein
MIESIIIIFAIYGFAFLVKDSDGPFDIIHKVRLILIQNKYVGVFFFKLFECYFCIGCHCGWIVYLLSQKTYSWQFFILWTVAGGAISLILNAILSRLYRD